MDYNVPSRQPRNRESASLEENPYWYKDAVIYEIHVAAFCDGNGDGIGDFVGLTEKLDYLQDLGVTALASPFLSLAPEGRWLRYRRLLRGSIPIYGTLADFKVFMREAHRRGIRVISELVLEPHLGPASVVPAIAPGQTGALAGGITTSGSDIRPINTKEPALIFKDSQISNWTWDPVGNAYFWHRFCRAPARFEFRPSGRSRGTCSRRSTSGSTWAWTACASMRSLIFTNAKAPIARTCPRRMHSSQTLRAHIDAKYTDRMLLAEANQWPDDAAAYFGAGDECQMEFPFPLMPRLFMSLHMEVPLPIMDILEQTPAVPETASGRLFLRNHDELTLEMVTDEERDYMCACTRVVRQARHQSRHPPPSRAVAREQSPADRVDQLAASFAAGDAHPLLWRRNRHGREYFFG